MRSAAYGGMLVAGVLSILIRLGPSAEAKATAWVQAWQGPIGAGNGLLEVSRNPDGSLSADLVIKALGCIGGINGLVFETSDTIKIMGDTKQHYPNGCAIVLQRRGKHLIGNVSSATPECAGLGGAGCELYNEIDLHRIKDIPAASSMSGYYYYIRHLKPH